MKQNLLQTTMTSILAFLLLATIVQPFIEANSLVTTSYFYLFLFVVTLILSFKKLSWWGKTPILMVVFTLTCYMYTPTSDSLKGNWFQQFAQNTLSSTTEWLTGKTGYFPEDLALIAFLLLSILLLSLLIVNNHWVLPALFCLVYLLTLSAINHAQLTKPIIAIAIIAYLTAFLQLSEVLTVKKIVPRFLISSLIFAIALGSAWYFPLFFVDTHQKIVNQTNPLRRQLREQNFYQNLRHSSTQALGRTGFSEDSSSLGGPIDQDQRLVFTAVQQKPHYWRIDSKDIYTGTGWKNSPAQKNKNQAEIVLIGDHYPNYQSEKRSVTINSATPMSYLPLPYGKVTWEIGENALQKGPVIEYNPENNRVETKISPENIYKNLTYTYQEPAYQIQDLQANRTFISEDSEKYLQLPENLPKRVKDLSKRLTEKSPTDYDKVKAIEHYLKNEGEFTYSLTDALFVPENRDYVDFFLFDSKFGYCEHFASAMVVLLRAADIPTRWARGFNEGTLTARNANGFNTYEIRNKNAHVWPEVYFETIGWVPFEPTPTFANPQQATARETTDVQTEQPTNVGAEETPKEQPTETKETTINSSQKEQTATSQADKENNQTVNGLSKKSVFSLLSILIVSLLLVSLFFFRHVISWSWYLMTLPLRRHQPFAKKYLSLLKRLEKIQARNLDESLQTYLGHLFTLTPDWKEPLTSLTLRYEHDFYGSSTTETNQQDIEKDFRLVALEARRLTGKQIWKRTH